MNKPLPYACRFDDMTWPLANQDTSGLVYELRYGSNKNLVAASIIEAYIELVNCSPRKRELVVRNIQKYSEIINRGRNE